MNRMITTASAAALLAITTATATLRAQEVEFLRGDVNSDGNISISDSLMMRRWLFNGDRPPSCLHAADFDDSGRMNITDQIMILNFAFLGGEPPAAPFPDLGVDSTPNEYAGGCEYAASPPEQTDDLIRIGDVEGVPGEIAFVPVFVKSSVEVEAFQVILEYDPASIAPLESRWDTETALQGTFYETVGVPYFGGRPVPGEPGILAFGFIPSLISTGFELPASEEETLAFRIPVEVKAGAKPGVVALTPTNGAGGSGVGPAFLRNELTNRGDARFVSSLPQTEGGFMQIVPDQTFFLRGDANMDGAVDISDGRFTLDFLFLGTDAPVCADAADSNDDGVIDIADSINTLHYLFTGGDDLPPPLLAPGLDPTEDELGCGKP